MRTPSSEASAVGCSADSSQNHCGVARKITGVFDRQSYG